MDAGLKLLTYKEYIDTCRRVIERCTAFETKGELWEHGINLAIVLDVHRPAVRDYVYKAVKSCKMDERRFLSALALAELRANPSLLDEHYESRKLG